MKILILIALIHFGKSDTTTMYKTDTLHGHPCRCFHIVNLTQKDSVELYKKRGWKITTVTPTIK